MGTTSIRGVDLSAEIDDAMFAQIERAFDEYGVVVFRDQKITPGQQVRFSRRFGPLDHYVLEQFNLPSAPEVFVILQHRRGWQADRHGGCWPLLAH